MKGTTSCGKVLLTTPPGLKDDLQELRAEMDAYLEKIFNKYTKKLLEMDPTEERTVIPEFEADRPKMNDELRVIVHAGIEKLHPHYSQFSYDEFAQIVCKSISS
jgi:hypothetical protein